MIKRDMLYSNDEKTHLQDKDGNLITSAPKTRLSVRMQIFRNKSEKNAKRRHCVI